MVKCRILKIKSNNESLKNYQRNISKEIANLTGIDQSDIYKLERGVANPSVNTLKRIADALDMKLNITIE